MLHITIGGSEGRIVLLNTIARATQQTGVGDTEEWRSVVGHKGRYEVSSLGRVRNVRFGRLLRGSPNQTGYLVVGLASEQGGDFKNYLLHVLVTEAFHGPRPGKYVARHKDGDRTNNRKDNLEWATYSQNNRDVKWHNPRRRNALPVPSVRSIKHLLSAGVARTEIASRFSVSVTTIANIDIGKTHSDVPITPLW